VGIRGGESRGVGCSSGLIDCDAGGSLRPHLSGIATCRGDSCCFPVLEEGCASFQDGPSLGTNSSCFLNNGVVRMGAGHGNRDEDAFGGEVSTSGKSSFRFPTTGEGWNDSHSDRVVLSLDNVLVSGCLGSKGLVGASVIETIGGNSDEGAAGGDGCGVVLGIGGISHGRGMRSSEEGPICLAGGKGISSGVGDLFHGAGMTGIAPLDGGVATQGGVGIRGNPTGGGLGMGTNGDGSTRGGDGTLGMIGGSGVTSLGKDDDGWI